MNTSYVTVLSVVPPDRDQQQTNELQGELEKEFVRLSVTEKIEGKNRHLKGTSGFENSENSDTEHRAPNTDTNKLWVKTFFFSNLMRVKLIS